LKILLCHNYYQQRGGEDEVFEAEAELLRSRGHSVVLHTIHNSSIKPLNAIQVGIKAPWNRQAGAALRNAARSAKPELIHFHNTFPLLSPAVYSAARSLQVPVVQTLHNYRPLCLNAIFYRGGSYCDDCLGRTIPWPGVLHGCYRGSRTQSLASALVNVSHHLASTWSQSVDLFLVFSKGEMFSKYQRAGFSPDKLFVKPNFLAPDPGMGHGQGGFALFVGRMEASKGLDELLKAWTAPGNRPPLKLVGDGPMLREAQDRSANMKDVFVLGRKSLQETLELMRQAAFIVFPSRMLEGMPRTIIEAFACGTPVLASRLGSMEQMIEENVTGAFFNVNDASDLATQAEKMHGLPDLQSAMRIHSRKEYEKKYTATINHELLMRAYDLARENFDSLRMGN
jgi:glycosyltransferase involved in cell wall biosynthesis